MVEIIFLNDSVFYQTNLFVFIINFQCIILAFKCGHDFNIFLLDFVYIGTCILHFIGKMYGRKISDFKISFFLYSTVTGGIVIIAILLLILYHLIIKASRYVICP